MKQCRAPQRTAFCDPTAISNLPHSNPSRRSPEAERELASSGPATVPGPAVSFAPGTRVVVAEDDRVSQAVLTMILQKLGLEVHVASDGQEALELIRAVAPALVMMDMQMPIMDGTEVVRALRRDASAPQPPVVVLSANRLNRAQEEELGTLGVADFLLKPVNRSRLQGVLVELLPKA